jgi:hypothetical protein
MKPITDKAEVSIDFPDKAYIGSFGRHSGFDVSADAEGVTLKLSRPGEDRRTAEIHLHYYLCADVLAELAKAIAARPAIDESHRDPMLKSVKKLAWALSGAPQHDEGDI